MSFPTIEFCRARATDGFKANPRDPALTKPSMDAVKATDGVRGVYYGLQEDKVYMNLVIAWDSLEHHKRLMASPGYAPLLQDLARMAAGDVSVLHVQANGEPYAALGAPVTEVVTVTAQAGHRPRVAEVLDEFGKTLLGLDKSSGVVSALWGPTVEKEDTFLMFIGWRDHEAPGKLIGSNATVSGLIGECHKFAKIELSMAELAAH